MKRLLTLLLALALSLSLCACASEGDPAAAPTAQTILTRQTGSYYPGGEINYAARIGNTLLMGGGGNLRLCEFEGTSFSAAQEIEYDGEEIWGIYALDGQFHVLADMVYGYSPDGELAGKSEEFPYSSEDKLFSVSVCAEGLVGSSFEGFTLLADGTALKLDSTKTGLGLAPTQGMNGELIIAGASAFFEADLETGEVTQLYYHGGLNDCLSVCRLDESTFVYTLSGDDALHIVSVTEEDAGEKSKVRVAILGSEAAYTPGEEDLSAGLIMMNSASDKYYYEYEYFTRDRLIAAISSNNSPDLVLFSNKETFGAAGSYLDTGSEYFENLYSYIDADPELSRESFIPNLLEALDVNGRITQLWTYVEIYSMFGRAKDVGGGNALTIADYNKIVEERGEYSYVFFGLTKSSLLSYMTTVALGEYVDKENVSCSFDDDSFAELIAWCNKVGTDELELHPEDPDALSRALLYVGAVSMPLHVSSRAQSYGKIEFVGHPVAEGSGSFYSAVGACFAIPALGSNKEGAWEYIRTQLSLESQLQPTARVNEYTGETWYKLPVHFEALKQVSAEVMEEKYCDQLVALIYDTTTARNYTDEALREIITTSCEAYFAGAKTIEETIFEIQSRASLYMWEKYS